MNYSFNSSGCCFFAILNLFLSIDALELMLPIMDIISESNSAASASLSLVFYSICSISAFLLKSSKLFESMDIICSSRVAPKLPFSPFDIYF